MGASILVAFFTTLWQKRQTPRMEKQITCQVVVLDGSMAS